MHLELRKAMVFRLKYSFSKSRRSMLETETLCGKNKTLEHLLATDDDNCPSRIFAHAVSLNRELQQTIFFHK